ncbi:MAG TPA: alcohol dehydrogenase catalytic domain-containing protein [Planctomycetota bacterium]|nr:alcohol dehydrogenase catalytic domain-containing protein [Planctomycetota bacterium]
MSETTTALRLVGSEAIDPSVGSPLRNLAVEDVLIGDPGPGEVLVEPLFTGVCGSDNSACLGKANFAWVQRPRTLGHEFSARIVAFGPGAEGHAGLRQGDVVCGLAMRGCQDPRCRGCRRGRWNYCRRKRIIGFHRDGALARRAILEVDRCVPLRPGITPLQAALVEPLSVVAQGVLRKCGIQPGMDVVVSGCGIMGLMAAELARAAGGRVAITGIERDRSVRLELARQRGFVPIVIGAELPLHERLRQGVEALDGTRFGDDFDDGLVDVLIECSGAPQALATAGLAVQPEGTICTIATYPCDVGFGATAFTRSGQSMQGVMGSSHEDYEHAQLLLQRGVLPVELYTQVYAFENAMTAMADSIAARTPKAIVAVQPA